MPLDRPLHCPECGEYTIDMPYEWGVRGKAGISDGRHNVQEIQVTIILGCTACSHTIKIWPIGEFLAALT